MGKIKIPSVTEIKNMKIDLQIDISLLNLIIGYLKKSTISKTRKTLTNSYKLFNMINEDMYEDNIEISSRIWLIKRILDKMVNNQLYEITSIYQEIKEEPEFNDYIKEIYEDINENKITYEVGRSIVKLIDDRVEYGYVITIQEIIQGLLDEIKAGSFKSYKAVSNDLQDIAQALININRNTRNIDAETTFSLQQEQFENVVKDSLAKLKDKQKVFVTGIQALNAILSPGYIGKRLYMYLAFPAGGKSQMLLKSALDIKKYNGPIKTKDPDKRPAVLLITMENDIDETVERMYNMLVDNDDIRNYSEAKIISKLKTEGGLTLTNNNNIDIIIKFFPHRSISTNDLYTIIQDFDDEGVEIIALILDYVKRIRPAEKAMTEKEELKNITNELKTLAKIKEIPVITAQQLNRTASSVVDAALTANKSDVTRLVGKDGVAGAWEIIENSDVVIVINKETKIDTKDKYLTFKLLKRRYRSSMTGRFKNLEYFNHPYEQDSDIKLIDDIDMNKSLSILSLSDTFVASESTRANAIEKENLNKEKKEEKKKKLIEKHPDEYEPFPYV